MNESDVKRILGFFRKNSGEMYTIRDVQKALKIDKMKVSGMLEVCVHFNALETELIGGRLVYRFKGR
jgi:response regulator of citrate/malate metabolism